MADGTGRVADASSDAREPTAGERRAKLARLAEVEGFGGDVAGLLAVVTLDAVSPAICVNPGCDYTAGMEPDQRRGHCERCGTGTVQAAPVLAGLI